MNRLVVIADGNVKRANQLKDACQSLDIPCKTAFHGAQALELALAECPTLIVARTDLPLVDALKLSEILRANPRTRTARFLFLDGDGTPSVRGGVGDIILRRAETPEEILPTLADMIETQERVERVQARTEGEKEAEGELSQLPLVELLQLLLVNRKSGRVELSGRSDAGESQTGTISICDGEVIQAQTGRVDGGKALFRLLGWRQGRFVFEPGRDDSAPKILTPTRSLLLEGLRQQEESQRMAADLPPLDAQVRLRVKSAELPNIVHPLTQEVLLLLELYPRVRDVVDHCSFPDYQVLRTLHTLVSREIVQLGRVSAPAPTEPTVGLFDEAQLRRLQSWISNHGSRASGRRDAKLLIAGAGPDLLPAFAQLLRRVPGIRLTPEIVERGISETSLQTIGRIAVEENQGIDLIHIPVDPFFSAIWPLAGHGALGTLFLLGGEVGGDAERVRPMADALHELPRARVFNVVMLGKDDRLSPEDLRENVSLIDEASLFLLPTESGKEPAMLLRSLFARIVP